MAKDKSGSRKTALYLGEIIALIGAFLLGTVFESGILHRGELQSYAKSATAQGLGGFALIVIGSIVMSFGAKS
jgi:hypothetical protein